MNSCYVAIVGAGPYGLSLASHLAGRNIPHRIFGHPMSFWSQIADAGGERYLKSYCFGTNISHPKPGSTFADYSKPRGLETFEPCAIKDFAAYGRWFQKTNVDWLEPVKIDRIARADRDFALTLDGGERVTAKHVVLATGLSYFRYTPSLLASLAPGAVLHTSEISDFSSFKGRSIAVIGGGQSALEAAALLREAGAEPVLLVRENTINWNTRVPQNRDFWQRLRSPISGLGTGPKAWALTHFPGAMHRIPSCWRARFVKQHLPPEGAWWLRERVEKHVPIHCRTTVLGAHEKSDKVVLELSTNGSTVTQNLIVDHVVSGTGYHIDVEQLDYLEPSLREEIKCYERAPRLNAKFESSARGLRFIGPASAMSFGPLFRFVVGADYTAKTVAADLALAASSKS